MKPIMEQYREAREHLSQPLGQIFIAGTSILASVMLARESLQSGNMLTAGGAVVAAAIPFVQGYRLLRYLNGSAPSNG